MKKTDVYIGEVSFLPLVDKDKIKKIVYEFDGEFIESVVARANFVKTLNKILDKAFVIVAIMENGIVGFSTFYINDFEDKTVYISLFAVRQKYQGMHLGSMMMDYIKSMSVLNNFEKIRLEVDNVNINGIEFYKKNSFVYEENASATSKYMVCTL